MLGYTFLLLLSVIFLDVCLSGDNAVVIAMAANGLPPNQRSRAIFAGMSLAAILRVVLAFAATTLLASRWVSLFGGLALLWVAYKLLWQILDEVNTDGPAKTPTSIWSAMGVILVADVSMSVDNVLAVAALARNHAIIMGVGILFSIALLTIAAGWVARLLQRWPWLNWLGLALILWVAGDLIWGSYDVVFDYLES
jgi:YjbE family integral membrane protein